MAISAALVTGGAVLAAPSLEVQQEASMPAVSAAGGGSAAVASIVGTAPAGRLTVSGEVVLWTPGEIVLHTAKGLERFQITPQTQMTIGAADGDFVTVVPAMPAVSTSGSVAPAGGTHSRVEGRAIAVTPQRAGIPVN
jgi:hypothetical protein